MTWNSWLYALPLLLQGLVISVDEFHFHRRRKLGRWERIGHPTDTLSLAIPVLLASWTAPTPNAWLAFIALSALSCLWVTKDEWVHAREASGGEQWVHSVLFILHPLVLGGIACLWRMERPGARALLRTESVVLISWMIYQSLYWNWNGIALGE